jgi:hypothetical protein
MLMVRSLLLASEHKAENIFGSTVKRGWKMRNGELHKLCSSTNITGAIISKEHEICGTHRNYAVV